MNSQVLKVTLIGMPPIVTILGIGVVMEIRSLIMFANHTVTPRRQASISSLGVCAAPFIFLAYSEVRYFTSIDHCTLAKVIDAGALASIASGAIFCWLGLLVSSVFRSSRALSQT